MEDAELDALRMEELLRATLRAFRRDDDSDDEDGAERGAAVRPPRPPERATPVVDASACSDPLGESDGEVVDSDQCADSDSEPCEVCAVPLAEQLAEAARRYLVHHATRSTARRPPAAEPVPSCAVRPAPAAPAAAPVTAAPAAPAAPACDAAAVWALCTVPLAAQCAPPAPRLPPRLTAGPSRRALASLLSAHASQQAALLKARSKELARQHRHAAREATSSSGSGSGNGGSGGLPPPDVVTTQIVFFARWLALCRRQQGELLARCTELLARQHGDEEQRAVAAHDRATAAARRALVKDYGRRRDDPAKVLAAFDERALGERSALVAQVRARHSAEAAQLALDAEELAAQTAAHFAALRATLEAAM